MLKKDCGMKIFIISTFFYLNIMVSETKHRLKNKEFGPNIVGGQPVALEKYPFAIQFFNLGALCGGAILNSWSILTSAHCLENNKDVDEMRVQIGSKYIYDFSATRHQLDSFVVHENYNKEIPFENDVAILFVKNPIKFNAVAKKALLVNHNKWMNAKEKRFVVTGWGWLKGFSSSDSFAVHTMHCKGCAPNIFYKPQLPLSVADDVMSKYGGSLSELSLMMAYLRYVPVKKCSRLHNIKLSDDMFCLYGDGERDTCRGDSGGGVLWRGRLVGLTSHGDGCAKKDKPSVYTNLWYLRGWIKKQVQNFIKNYCRKQNLSGTGINMTIYNTA